MTTRSNASCRAARTCDLSLFESSALGQMASLCVSPDGTIYRLEAAVVLKMTRHMMGACRPVHERWAQWDSRTLRPSRVPLD